VETCNVVTDTDAVRALQKVLNARGFDAGDTDGFKGPNTLDACFAYAADTLLDGQPELPAELRFKGAARRLDDIDLPRIGHLIGVGEDELHAVIDVEARGSGFDSLGRIAMQGGLMIVQIPERTREVAYALAGTILSLVMMVGHFFFGNSEGSKQKTGILARVPR